MKRQKCPENFISYNMENFNTFEKHFKMLLKINNDIKI